MLCPLIYLTFLNLGLDNLSKMWGIGSKMEKNLNSMGIFSVGALANHPLKLLENKFGVIGSQLYHHAWGIDLSKIGEPVQLEQISFGKSQILLRDYPDPKEVKQVILEGRQMMSVMQSCESNYISVVM
jgi:DNA polymerase V